MRLTLPVQSDRRVPEVVADLVARHALHRVRCFERVQDDAVLLHLPPVHLERTQPGETGSHVEQAGPPRERTFND